MDSSSCARDFGAFARRPRGRPIALVLMCALAFAPCGCSAEGATDSPRAKPAAGARKDAKAEEPKLANPAGRAAIPEAGAASSSPLLPPAAAPNEFHALTLAGARAEVAKQTVYVENYEVMEYPGGDVKEGGVCTDLIVRAFRRAGVDLQKLVHEDRVAHADAYPTKLWDMKKPDKNIDHRRCQNMVVWFKRNARSLTTLIDAANQKEWAGGDVVFFVHEGSSHPWHVAIISDKRAPDGVPLVIHSFPPRTSEGERVDRFGPIHSHFRLERDNLKPAKSE